MSIVCTVFDRLVSRIPSAVCHCCVLQQLITITDIIDNGFKLRHEMKWIRRYLHHTCCKRLRLITGLSVTNRMEMELIIVSLQIASDFESLLSKSCKNEFFLVGCKEFSDCR